MGIFRKAHADIEVDFVSSHPRVARMGPSTIVLGAGVHGGAANADETAKRLSPIPYLCAFLDCASSTSHTVLPSANRTPFGPPIPAQLGPR